MDTHMPEIIHYSLFPIVQAFPLFNQQYQRQDFHQVLFPGESTSLWTISPPSRDLLRQQLYDVTTSATSSILLQFTWSLTRLAHRDNSLCSHTSIFPKTTLFFVLWFA